MSDDLVLLGKQETESAIHRRANFSKYQISLLNYLKYVINKIYLVYQKTFSGEKKKT